MYCHVIVMHCLVLMLLHSRHSIVYAKYHIDILSD